MKFFKFIINSFFFVFNFFSNILWFFVDIIIFNIHFWSIIFITIRRQYKANKEKIINFLINTGLFKFIKNKFLPFIFSYLTIFTSFLKNIFQKIRQKVYLITFYRPILIFYIFMFLIQLWLLWVKYIRFPKLRMQLFLFNSYVYFLKKLKLNKVQQNNGVIFLFIILKFFYFIFLCILFFFYLVFLFELCRFLWIKWNITAATVVAILFFSIFWFFLYFSISFWNYIMNGYDFYIWFFLGAWFCAWQTSKWWVFSWYNYFWSFSIVNYIYDSFNSIFF